jgi:hypothetical protein
MCGCSIRDTPTTYYFYIGAVNRFYEDVCKKCPFPKFAEIRPENFPADGIIPMQMLFMIKKNVKFLDNENGI